MANKEKNWNASSPTRLVSQRLRGVQQWDRPIKCFNCQVAGDKAAECKKEGGAAHTGPQQPSAKKKMFQTAAAQLKEMERVDKLVAAMQLQGKYVEKLMEAIASLPDSGVGCKLCVHACRARASERAAARAPWLPGRRGWGGW